ncbi:MAG: murein L,D-transpeptidase catalytic domain family protein [Bernardetiaceae bacterium]|nr:murein L,D-transpeptidase catalytic domain family protein [Bernardetiaceae bacterium]
MAAKPTKRHGRPASALLETLTQNLYQNAELERHELNPEVLRYALTGYLNLRGKGQLSDRGHLTVIDFSLPSTQKRMWIIDVVNQRMLLRTYVAHGVNSGLVYANKFSNTPESYQSSLGFYVTAETYEGKHGLSLVLEGKERGINCQARPRAIVLHGADYVSAENIARQGRLGRSQGCPAVPMPQKDKIINLVKNRTCLFIYYPDQRYLDRSELLNQTYSGLLQ